MNENISCRICGCQLFNKYFEFGEISLYKCDKCGTVSSFSSKEKSEKMFNDKYLGHLKSNSRASDVFFDSVIDMVKKYKKNGSVLDVGFGAGHFLNKMFKEGYQVHGVEISENACKYVKATYGIDNIYCGDLAQVELGRSFDIVTMWDSLQCVDEPKLYINKVHSLLEDEGLFVIQVPNRGTLNFKYARFLSKIHGELARVFLHVPAAKVLFDEKTITCILEGLGFKVKYVYEGSCFRKFKWGGGFNIKSIIVNIIENAFIAMEKLFNEKHPLIIFAQKI